MNCCENCFNSEYLISIIKADDRIGNCNFCNSSKVFIYSARELVYFFRNIFSIYNIDEGSNLDIVQSLKKDFNLTTDKVVNPKRLYQAIFDDEMDEVENLFNNNVISEVSIQNNTIHDIWDNFKKEIKFSNRFFYSEGDLNFDVLRSIFESSLVREIFQGESFFRSRISSKDGFEKENMGNPPKPELTSAGRANPKGISYLYLADSLNTALYEVRSSIFDYITVGKFLVEDKLKIISFRDIATDPIYWSEKEDIKNYIKYLPLIYTIQKELSLPIRKKDKTLDYIPTQYICEYIKSLGFDGVEYQSSLYSQGYNLAIFKPKKLNCVETKVYEIEKIKLHHKPLDK